MEPIAKNKKAYFDYKIVDDLEAGLVLAGTEIKAIRAKKINMTGSHIRPFVQKNGRAELWWLGTHFGVDEGDQTRTKKLLVSRSDIEKIVGKLTAKGYTIVPLELYLKRGRAKLKIGLAERKKPQDRREELRRHDLDREVEREFRERQKN